MKNHLFKKANLLVISFALVALVLNSCSSDDTIDNVFMISFEANGVLEKFAAENSPSGHLINYGTPFRLTINAEKPSATVSLAVFDNKAIAVGAYNGLDVKQSDTHYSVAGAQIGYQKNELNYASERLASSDVSITILEITPNTVRGKFSGKVYRANEAEIVIANGDFFIPISVSDD